MLFSSLTFLFAFLPLCLAGYYVVPSKARNCLLLAASLLFYAWGEGPFITVMLASIALNWSSGMAVHAMPRGRARASVMTAAVAANLLLLGTFKYANFFFGVGVHLPIGISFFTFHGLSYLIDVYRSKKVPERSPLRVALYIALFPQLVAGPIVRYADIAAAIRERTSNLDIFASGIARFAIGLGKKVLLANTLAEVADRCFARETFSLSASNAWLGLVAYSLQIYFDFSGYSDMAIGLARMFGFQFRENFNFPYAARSITDFWRRWHISLSTWFRDYLYIPLGGNRSGAFRTYVHLAVVFLLCGLWHGASWNFIIWGAIHGCFLVIERIVRTSSAQQFSGPLSFLARLYTLLVVMLAWVFFRADSIPQALAYLKTLFGFASGESQVAMNVLDLKSGTTLAVAMVACLPVVPWLKGKFSRLETTLRWQWIAAAGVVSVFWLAVFSLAAGTHNPFIYFRF